LKVVTLSLYFNPCSAEVKRPAAPYVFKDGASAILTLRSNTMQITSKGQVTIPQEIRERLGLLPHTEVEFSLAGDHAQIRKAARPARGKSRGQKIVEALRGTASLGMSTDEIMALMRGEPE
jgi:AbrB family looped-hinge helix DNA binding protein